MSGFNVRALDHVNVTTPEELEEEVIAWYGEVLGLKRLDKPSGTRARGAWFSLGVGELHVSLDPHNPPQGAHLALEVEDFEAAVEHLRSHDCHIEQAHEIPGRHRFFTRDPAGNRIELTALDSKGHA